MAKVYKLTHQHLLEVLDFDPATGIFVWKVSRSNRVKPGSRAGVLHQASGGRYISIDNEKFMAHRLAFFYANARWPDSDVRPVDGNYNNCSIVNLTEISRVELQHRRGAISTNTTGYAGVSPAKNGKFQAKITWNYQQIALGTNYPSAEAASEVYEEAHRRLKIVTSQIDADRAIAALKVWRGQRTAWRFLHRSHEVHEWASFEEFCADVNDVPSMRYAMVPVDVTEPIGPGNFRWAFPADASRQTPEGRVVHNLTRRVVNRDHQRNKHIMKNYGITFAEEQQLRNEQMDVCAICDNGFGDEAPAVDHDHVTERVRGLLCKQCNFAMGQFHDNSRLLRRAAEFLERHAASTWSAPCLTEITHVPIGQKILLENRPNG